MTPDRDRAAEQRLEALEQAFLDGPDDEAAVGVDEVRPAFDGRDAEDYGASPE